jgi:LuxR family maltose regulon positive regulatory protein
LFNLASKLWYNSFGLALWGTDGEMETTPLVTKLYIPPTRRPIVSRLRLIEQLNAGLNYKLILISASAGFGKTTLLSEWARLPEPPKRVAWVSLDEGDNDPVRFWGCFVAALRTLQECVGGGALALLHSPEPVPIDSLLTTLTNDVATISGDLVFVLDDYNIIKSQPIHSGITFLLDHVPPQMHLVIATRADPPLPLARLRGHGLMSEIRTDDLRFTSDEAATFLSQVVGLNLSQEQVAALDSRIEGWAAGLYMVALSLRARKDVSGFIKAFTGSHRYILDYLIEEVLQRQPSEIQDFLLKTSILDHLSAPLCNAICERDDSQDVLPFLEHANLFLVPLDESRQWYRYEHPLADALRHQLDMICGASHVRLLHRRASQWYETNDFPVEAVHHALIAQDWERAAMLIYSFSNGLLRRGQVVTLLGWLQTLPDSELRGRPELCQQYGWVLILTGQLGAAESYLGHAERAASENPALLGEIMAARAYIARIRGEEYRTIELSERALSLLQENLQLRSVVALNLGITYRNRGSLSEAEQALREANQAAQQSDNEYVRLTSVGFLADILAARGKLHQAAELCRRAIGVGEESAMAAFPYHVLGGLLYEWNELKAAADHLQRAIRLSQLTGNVEIQGGAYHTLARIKIAQGDTAGALDALDKADHLAQSADFPPLDRARHAACHVEIALAQGDLSSALHWVNEISEDADASLFHPNLNLIQARLFMAQGQREAAAKELEARYEVAAQAGWQYGVIEIRLLQALAAATPDGALAFVVDALTLAQPEGYIRIFVDKGERMAILVRQAAAQRMVSNYVATLLTAFDAEQQKVKHREGAMVPSAHPPSQPILEPLSQRELEVLRHLFEGMSNREIAERLFISTGTVKTHIHNIFGKLNVQSRTQAITRARELGLI